MRKHFNSDPRNLVAAIGPGVRGCCYEVGEEVRTRFEGQFSYASRLFREVKESDPVREKYPLLFLTARAPGHGELPAKLFLNLVEANRRQLLDAGVPARNIDADGTVHSVPSRNAVQLPGREGCDGAADGRGRNKAGLNKKGHWAIANLAAFQWPDDPITR